MRRALAVAVAALVLVPAAGSVTGTPPINVWSGQWVTNTATGGGVAFRAVAAAGGVAAIKKLQGEPCAQPTTYYRGGYYDPKSDHSGEVVGCTEGSRELVARYVGDKSDPDASGDFDVEYVAAAGGGRAKFVGTYTPDGGEKHPYLGYFLQHFKGDGCCAGLVVTFSIRAFGKPNLPVKGVRESLVAARLSGSGHATFTTFAKGSSTILEATETKGKITLDETDAAGTKHHLELGIISGTLYAPTTRRLALLLKVESSDDPACPAEGNRAATLNLLPTFHSVRDTAIFFGVPYSQNVDPFGFITSSPCKGQAHGWEGGSGGVVVRALLAESPGA